MSDLTGRIALVTGASTGLGRATAIELAQRGATVVINYPYERERANAEKTRQLVHAARSQEAEYIGGSGFAGVNEDAYEPALDSLLVRADVSKEAEVEAMFATIAETYGPLDILVNNAGIQIEEPASHETTAEHFDLVLAVNLRGAFLCAREALKQFISKPLPTSRRPRGVIINVSSVHQKIPRPFYLSYAVSKYGIKGMTETLALEYADKGIRVNSIAPGATLTPIQSWLDDEETQEIVESHIPMGRIAQPEEMARIAAFLASDDAAYVTGQTLYADGGLTLYPEFREPWSG